MVEYKFTIFTPLYNGAKTIHRVIESLENSTYRNFEWIVVNDGSTDDSINILKSLVKNKDWDLTIIDWRENHGKHIAWNEAAKIAKGEIFIVIDCDDAFASEALSFFNEKWNLYFDNNKICGVNALCVDANTKKVSGTKYPYDGAISNYGDFLNIYKVRGDKMCSFRTKYVRMFPFPEIKANYYTECYLHYSLGERFLTVGYNEKLYYYYYEISSITHTRVETKDNLYMIAHYQRWHIPRVAISLLKTRPRELARCIKELIITTIKYKMMSWLKIKEVRYLSD
jgi:glycosyltransferase involved in cell wall biosynthesis